MESGGEEHPGEDDPGDGFAPPAPDGPAPPTAYPPPAYPPPAVAPYGYPPGGYGAPPPGGGPYGYPPPGAGPYGYGYGMPSQRNNSLAIASLVMGVLAFATCQLVGIGALITGYKARRQIRETGEQGNGMALAGIILGWVSLVLFVGVILFYAAFIAFAVSSSSTSSTFSTVYTPTTYRSPTTTERILTPARPTPGSGVPGSSVVPAGVIPVEACTTVTLALRNLEEPANNDRGIVIDAARTLHDRYPASSADDIDVVLADSLSRVNRDTTGARGTEVLAAMQRLDGILAASCPG